MSQRSPNVLKIGRCGTGDHTRGAGDQGDRGDSKAIPSNIYAVGNGLRIDRARLHGTIREIFMHQFRSLSRVHVDDTGVVLLQGGALITLYSSDTDVLFRQEPFFHYLFGVDEPGCWGAQDIRTGQAFLFIPRTPAVHEVWTGPKRLPQHYVEKYGVDEVHYVDEMVDVLKQLAPPSLHLLVGVDSDSGLSMAPTYFAELEEFTLECRGLYPSLTEMRVFKLDMEVDILRYCARVAAAAHVKVMQATRPGMFEYELEALFLYSIYVDGGCRFSPFTPILGSGPNSAIIYYGDSNTPHDRRMKAGDFLLVEAGAEYYRYGSDLTCTFPVTGKFSAKQRTIYEAVLSAHQAVLEAMKPHMFWPDLHQLAERRILMALSAAGLVVGEIHRLMEARVCSLFMPHGLGHFLGKQTHDVGGYVAGKFRPRPTQAGLNCLRTARVLEVGMVMTVKPGCYFIPALLEPQLQGGPLQRYLVPENIRKYMSMGGVRLEDDVVITATGAESLAKLPRTVAEVEAVMAGAAWKP